MGAHGFRGIKLKTTEYTKKGDNSDAEKFLFHACEFSDEGKILNVVLLREYQNWKKSIGKELTENDMCEIKDYLNAVPYALKATVWTDEGNNEGYYGLSLKQKTPKQNAGSSTGKKIEKRDAKTKDIIKMWPTIAKAAEEEHVSSAKMSRLVKYKEEYNGHIYVQPNSE
jgi:hypothetical protein